jgi:hypothetical protein
MVIRICCNPSLQTQFIGTKSCSYSQIPSRIDFKYGNVEESHEYVNNTELEARRMSLLLIVAIIFVLMEISNVFFMYFKPGSTKANSVGVFNAWENSKQYPEIHDFVRYLVNWVAGTKLIFLSLLTVIIILGDSVIKFFGVLALVISISTFYWRLYPLIRKMDGEGQVTPKNYSRTVATMILVMIITFTISLILQYLGITWPL